MAGKYQVRSISLPSRFHPTSVRVEQEINSLKSLEGACVSSSNEVCSLLAGLEEAYNCVEELVNMQSGCESTCKNEQWLNDLIDGSVKILDICNTSRETMLMAKGHVQGIQSVLRRRKDDSSVQRSVSEYLSYRKHMIKNAMKMIALLKQVNQVSTPTNLDENSSRLTKVLTDVTSVTISAFESLLTFLVASSSVKATKWSVVSRLMNKKVAVHAQQDAVLNEFASVDVVISKNSSSQVLPIANKQILLERLAALEDGIGGIEARLECIFRCLVKLRVALLNKISS